MSTRQPHPTANDSNQSAPQPPMFSRLARFMAVHRRSVIILWLALVGAAAPLAIGLNGALSGAGWDAKGSDAQAVRSELRSDFPALGAENPIVVLNLATTVDESPDVLEQLVADLERGPEVKSVVDPLATPPEAGLVSPDRRTILIPVAQNVSDDADRPIAAGRLSEFVSELDLRGGARAEVTGEWPMWADFNEMNEEALHKAELLSGLPTLIMLFIAFGALLAAGIPLILALAGIAVGFASLHLLTFVSPMSVWSMNFSMMIGLAVGIDYSLFIVSRYREERAEGRTATTAIENTMSTAGKAVFLSALTVVLSLSAVFLVPVMVFQTMALGMILSVVAVAVASITLLPAVLVAMGDRVLIAKGQTDPDVEAEGRWARWTGVALRHPGRVLALGLILLGTLAAPAFGMRLGMPGARVVDEGRSSRDGYETLVSAFGPGAAAPAFITVGESEANSALSATASVDNVVDARIVTAPSERDRIVIRAIPGTPIDDRATSDMISDLRSALAPVAASALVGGPAAQNHDQSAVLVDRAPYAIGVILLVAFVLLLIVFRSVVIAIFSILMNLVTVGGAFGFATLVFQNGWGASLIGIESQGFVDAWAPLFFFALLFGLSMDYQLFLLAAIRERFQSTGDTRLSIEEGIARTGRPITNAAVIMIIVFVAFGVTGPIPPTELGLTLAVAVFLDATVVRVMLVPATMALLGDRSWYAPKWMQRVLPHVNFNH